MLNKIGVVVLLLTAVLLMASAAYAEGRLPPHLTVRGQASVAEAPDRAVVTAGVETRAKTAAEAMAANAALMSKAIIALKAAGVQERHIQTRQLSVYPIYERTDRKTNRQELVGYQASNTVAAKTAQIDRTGDVIDAMVAAGVNRIQGVSFEISNPGPLADKALAAAVADARRKAEIMAEAAGAKLGPVLSIQEGGHGGGGPRPEFMAMDAARAATPVQPGEQSVGVSVILRFAIRE